MTGPICESPTSESVKQVSSDLLIVGDVQHLGPGFEGLHLTSVPQVDESISPGSLGSRVIILLDPELEWLEHLERDLQGQSPVTIVASSRDLPDILPNAIRIELQETRRPGFSRLVRGLLRDRKEKQAHEVLARITHDMRSPMSVIKMAGQLLQRNHDDPEKVYNFSEMITAGAQEIQTLIEDILDFAKLDQGRCELNITTFNLPHLLSTVIESTRLLAHNKTLQVEMSLDSRLPKVVEGDPGRLRQILGNLLNNAVKFTEAGVVKLRCWSRNQDCFFEVSDTGIGIAESSLKDVFEPYRQADRSIYRRFGGTGLGLNICKLLAEAMNGHISADSKLGIGSSFLVQLHMPEARFPEHSHAPVVWQGLKVYHNEMKVPRGWKAHADALGIDLAPLQKRGLKLNGSSKQTHPDVLVFDLRQGGFFELEKLLHEFPEKRPFVVTVTNSGQRGDAVQCKRLGVRVYLTGNFSFENLRSLIGIGLQSDSTDLLTRHTLKERNLLI